VEDDEDGGGEIARKPGNEPAEGLDPACRRAYDDDATSDTPGGLGLHITPLLRRS
jgi:hypothetical protein